MIAPLLALALQATPAEYKLLPGDTWTVERTLHYHGGELEIDMTEVESIVYVVSGNNGKVTLTGAWKLKETQVDGQAAPVAKDIPPILNAIALKGEPEKAALTPADLGRYRIERMLRWGRPEPIFWSLPEKSRAPKVTGEVKFVGSDKTGIDTFSLDRREASGDWPMSSHGEFTIQSSTGIVLAGKWTIVNAPIPGGDDVYDLDVAQKTVSIKLAPR